MVVGLHLAARAGQRDLVMILDIFSRKVAGWGVFLADSAENSRTVIKLAVLSEKIVNQPLVLHSDNGSQFKGVTLLEKLRDLQIAPHFAGHASAMTMLFLRRCSKPVNTCRVILPVGSQA